MLDEDGNQLATTTTDENGDYGFADLAPGTYIVEFVAPDGSSFSPVDQGDDDEKDSDAAIDTGRTAPIELQSGDNNDTVDAGLFTGTSLGDRVFEDTNGNGIQDDGEEGISDVTVKLLDENGDELSSITTDENGNYRFTGLEPGGYIVEVTLPEGYSVTLADQGDDDTVDSDFDEATNRSPVIQLVSNEDNNTVDAGLYRTGSIGDFLFVDFSGDGIQDADEGGASEITVNLLDEDGNVLATTETDETGAYSFDDLAPGTYIVEIVLPEGSSIGISPKDAGDDDTQDSDFDQDTARTDPIELGSGEDNNDVDGGITPLRNIGDLLFNDLNGNGIQEDDEPGVGNQVVTLLDANGNVLETTVTDLSGRYEFTNVRPGTYQVRFSINDEYRFTQSDQGDDDAKDSDANPETGLTQRFVLDGTGSVDDIDAGVFRPITITGEAFLDDNDNALQEEAEAGVSGIRVDLLDSDGNVIRTTTTDTNGVYLFEDVAPGDYIVRFIPGADYELVAQNQGSDDTIDSDADPTTGRTLEFSVVSGDNVEDIDAGLTGTDVLGVTPTPQPQSPPTIQKDARPDITRSGRPIEFDIVVSNPNSTELRNVTITDTLSNRFIYQSATSTPNGTVSFSEATNMLVVTVPSIQPNQNVTITVRVIVKTSTLPGTVINNVATVTSSAGNDQDSADVTVIPEEIPNTGVDQLESLNIMRDVLLLLGLLMGTVAILWFVSRGRNDEDLLHETTHPAAAARMYVALGLVFIMLFGILGWGILRWSSSLSDTDTAVAGVAIEPVSDTALANEDVATEDSQVVIIDPNAVTEADETTSELVPLTDDNVAESADTQDDVGSEDQALEEQTDAQDDAAELNEPATDSSDTSTEENVIVDLNDPRIPHLIIPRLEINEAITDIPIEGVSWNLDDLGGQIGWLHTTGAEPFDKYAMVFAAHVTLGSTAPGPFLNLDQLQSGDEIIYRWNNVDYIYKFSESEYVDPSAVEELYVPNGETLILVTCSNWNEEEETFDERLLATATFLRQQPVN